MIIKDKLISPFEIHSNEHGGYALKEFKGMRENKDGQAYPAFGRTYYLPSVGACLKRLIQIKMSDKDSVFEIKNYLKEYNSIKESLAVLFNEYSV